MSTIAEALKSLKEDITEKESIVERFLDAWHDQELIYDDLGVEVSGTFGGTPVKVGQGTGWTDEQRVNGVVNHWIYYADFDDYSEEDIMNLIANYLDKKPEEITEEDVAPIIEEGKNYEDSFARRLRRSKGEKIVEGPFERFLLDTFVEKAQKDAEENYDFDDVEWNI